MDVDTADKYLCEEVVMLGDEAMKNHARVEFDENEARGTMALAQVVVVHQMMMYLKDTEDWSDFEEMLYEWIDDEDDRYREARARDDLMTARIAMARLRIMTTLSRRLADPQRRLLIGISGPGTDTPPRFN